jgi:hypothetical protein
MWYVPRCYKQVTKTVESEFYAGGCEAEESPLLEAVTRERQKGLAGAVVVMNYGY